MAQYSLIIKTAWNISASEAKNGCAEEIDPEHFLLGFLKLSDIDLDDFFSGTNHFDSSQRKNFENDITELCSLYQQAEVEPIQVRRRLRKLISKPAN